MTILTALRGLKFRMVWWKDAYIQLQSFPTANSINLFLDTQNAINICKLQTDCFES